MKVGVSDFLIKPVAEPVLREAVEMALVNGRRQHSRASRIAFPKERYGSLTHQERVVARFVCEGHRNRDIASALPSAPFRTIGSWHCGDCPLIPCPIWFTPSRSWTSTTRLAARRSRQEPTFKMDSRVDATDDGSLPLSHLPSTGVDD
ncbi:hypothetical protein QTI24_31110 [Variovorax sp. J22P240]|uniref:hypothetical protein n=1 Tax=Variovorax sp. J22P240 TaxID=3053514 RepID=UPI0025761098|nr:hypothetical protein [Variovorax sp. J22P240]MDM0003064.1 hypothetical protein [Variovorax sp. J22P240]